MSKHVKTTVADIIGNHTQDAYGNNTNIPAPKVISATAGAVIGGSITTLGVYIFETLTGHDLPQLVEGSILTLVSAGVAFVSAYATKPLQ